MTDDLHQKAERFREQVIRAFSAGYAEQVKARANLFNMVERKNQQLPIYLFNDWVNEFAHGRIRRKG
jgi:hypothetical protein